MTPDKNTTYFTAHGPVDSQGRGAHTVRWWDPCIPYTRGELRPGWRGQVYFCTTAALRRIYAARPLVLVSASALARLGS